MQCGVSARERIDNLCNLGFDFASVVEAGEAVEPTANGLNIGASIPIGG
jgi:hypothetical protein